MSKWETSEEIKAIEHINKAMNVELPDNQLAMPQACNTKIKYINKAIELLKKDIENLETTANFYSGQGGIYINNRSKNKYKTKRKTLKAYKK
jgi:hypothetical protein